MNHLAAVLTFLLPCVLVLPAAAADTPFAAAAAPAKHQNNCARGAACRHRFGTQVQGNTCRVVVDVDQTVVHAGDDVTWEIVDHVHVLAFDPSKGVDIAGASPDFVDGRVGPTPNVYVWTASTQSTQQPHAYDLNIFWMKPGTDGIKCKVLDPVIVNQL